MLFDNRDTLPPLPSEIKKEKVIAWGESMVSRSQKYADDNRFGAVYVRPIVTVLTGVTGAAGVAAVANGWFGLLVVVLSAVGTALNALLSTSNPEALYKRDRAQQSELYEELNYFKISSGKYSGISDAEACNIFILFVTDSTNVQIQEWAGRKSGDRRSKETSEPTK